MPVDFHIPSLRIQVKERMSEEASERIRLQQLLALSEMRVRSLAILELDQQGHARVSDTHGEDAQKIAFPVDRAVLDSRGRKRHVYARHPSQRNLFALKVNEVSTKTIRGAHTTESLRNTRGPHAKERRPTPSEIILGVGAHLSVNMGRCTLM